jgi:hypothetical protein
MSLATTAAAMRVAVAAAVTVAVAMLVEQHQSNEIRGKPQASNNENELGVADSRGVDQALNCLQENRQAQRKQKHPVDERTKDLCTLPAIGIL